MYAAKFFLWSANIQRRPSSYVMDTIVAHWHLQGLQTYPSRTTYVWDILLLVPWGAADRAGGVELGEKQSLICHSLDVGGGGGGVAIGREITPTKLRNQEDIKFIWKLKAFTAHNVVSEKLLHFIHSCSLGQWCKMVSRVESCWFCTISYSNTLSSLQLVIFACEHLY